MDLYKVIFKKVYLTKSIEIAEFAKLFENTYRSVNISLVNEVKILSNKMGIDKYSVVDEHTKVHGVQNLRVVDSSIMPDIVSGNLNAATIMIAEKVSDMILGKEENPLNVSYHK